jgi:uncharacterized repeat protein (TIGR01451 family)
MFTMRCKPRSDCEEEKIMRNLLKFLNSRKIATKLTALALVLVTIASVLTVNIWNMGDTKADPVGYDVITNYPSIYTPPGSGVVTEIPLAILNWNKTIDHPGYERAYTAERSQYYNGTATPNHVVLDNSTIRFMGYGVEPYMDIYFTDDYIGDFDSASFTMRPRNMNFHSFSESGFLFNGSFGGANNEYYTGYAVILKCGNMEGMMAGGIGTMSLVYMQNERMNGNSYSPGTLASTRTLIATIKRGIETLSTAPYDIRIEYRNDGGFALMLDGQLAAEVLVPKTNAKGLGFFTGYYEHNCSILSVVQYENVSVGIKDFEPEETSARVQFVNFLEKDNPTTHGIIADEQTKDGLFEDKFKVTPPATIAGYKYYRADRVKLDPITYQRNPAENLVILYYLPDDYSLLEKHAGVNGQTVDGTHDGTAAEPEHVDLNDYIDYEITFNAPENLLPVSLDSYVHTISGANGASNSYTAQGYGAAKIETLPAGRYRLSDFRSVFLCNAYNASGYGEAYIFAGIVDNSVLQSLTAAQLVSRLTQIGGMINVGAGARTSLETIRTLGQFGSSPYYFDVNGNQSIVIVSRSNADSNCSVVIYPPTFTLQPLDTYTITDVLPDGLTLVPQNPSAGYNISSNPYYTVTSAGSITDHQFVQNGQELKFQFSTLPTGATTVKFKVRVDSETHYKNTATITSNHPSYPLNETSNPTYHSREDGPFPPDPPDPPPAGQHRVTEKYQKWQNNQGDTLQDNTYTDVNDGAAYAPGQYLRNPITTSDGTTIKTWRYYGYQRVIAGSDITGDSAPIVGIPPNPSWASVTEDETIILYFVEDVDLNIRYQAAGSFNGSVRDGSHDLKTPYHTVIPGTDPYNMPVSHMNPFTASSTTWNYTGFYSLDGGLTQQNTPLTPAYAAIIAESKTIVLYFSDDPAITIQYREYLNDGHILKQNEQHVVSRGDPFDPMALTPTVTNDILEKLSPSDPGRNYEYVGYSLDGGAFVPDTDPETLTNVQSNHRYTLYFRTNYTIIEKFHSIGGAVLRSPDENIVTQKYGGESFQSGVFPYPTLPDPTNPGDTSKTWYYVGYRIGSDSDTVTYSYPSDPMIASVNSDFTVIYVYEQRQPSDPTLVKDARVSDSTTFSGGYVTGVPTPESVKQGQYIEYRIVLTNPAGAAATVSDLLPEGLTFVSATPTQAATNAVGRRTEVVWASTNAASATYLVVAQVTGTGLFTNSASAVVGTKPITSNPVQHETPPTANAVINGTKIVNGTPPASETFTFTLTQVANANGDAYVGTPITTSLTATTNGAGTFSFTVPGLTAGAGGAAKDYYFKVTETNNGTVNWTYDPAVKIVKVTVSGTAAPLTVAVSGNNFSFTNSYNSTKLLHIRQIVVDPISGLKTPIIGYFKTTNATKTIPLTGDSGIEGNLCDYTGYVVTPAGDMKFSIYDYIPQYYEYIGYYKNAGAAADTEHDAFSNHLTPDPGNGSIFVDYTSDSEWWVTVYITPTKSPGDYGWDYGHNDFKP